VSIYSNNASTIILDLSFIESLESKAKMNLKLDKTYSWMYNRVIPNMDNITVFIRH